MTEFEARLTAAFHARAAEAPDPGPLVATLPLMATAQTPGRAGPRTPAVMAMVGVAAAVVVVTGVSAYFLHGDSTNLPSNSPTTLGATHGGPSTPPITCAQGPFTLNYGDHHLRLVRNPGYAQITINVGQELTITPQSHGGCFALAGVFAPGPGTTKVKGTGSIYNGSVVLRPGQPNQPTWHLRAVEPGKRSVAIIGVCPARTKCPGPPSEGITFHVLPRTPR